MYMLCARYAKTHVLGASSSSFRTEASEEKKKMLYRDQVGLDIASRSFITFPKLNSMALYCYALSIHRTSPVCRVRLDSDSDENPVSDSVTKSQTQGIVIQRFLKTKKE